MFAIRTKLTTKPPVFDHMCTLQSFYSTAWRMCHTWNFDRTMFYCWPQCNWITFSKRKPIRLSMEKKSTENTCTHYMKKKMEKESRDSIIQMISRKIFKLIINIYGEWNINCLQCHNSLIHHIRTVSSKRHSKSKRLKSRSDWKKELFSRLDNFLLWRIWLRETAANNRSQYL